MILRPSNPEDLDELFADLRDEDLEAIERMGGVANARAVVNQLIEAFPHQVFITEDGKVAALFIGLRKWDGVIEIIGYTSNAAEDNIFGFYKASIRGVDYLSSILGAHKVECIVWGGYQRSINWLQRLGFKQEGYLVKHGPDQSDATLMGRVM